MLIGHFMPSYGEPERDAVSTVVWCQAWCQQNDHNWDFWTAGKQPIDCNRNTAIKRSLAREHDLLLMQDADCYVDPEAGPLIYRLLQTLDANDAAVASVALPCRHPGERGARANCSPIQMGEVYEARTAGTGLILLDMRKLRGIALPWFEFKRTADGCDIEVSEDVFFVRLAIKEGHRVMIDWTIPALHSGTVALGNMPPEAPCTK